MDHSKCIDLWIRGTLIIKHILYWAHTEKTGHYTFIDNLFRSFFFIYSHSGNGQEENAWSFLKCIASGNPKLYRCLHIIKKKIEGKFSYMVKGMNEVCRWCYTHQQMFCSISKWCFPAANPFGQGQWPRVKFCFTDALLDKLQKEPVQKYQTVFCMPLNIQTKSFDFGWGTVF